MKNYAIIQNNKIVNIIVADDAFIAMNNMQAIDATDKYVKMGMDLINGQIPTVQQLIEKAISENLPQERQTNILELFNSMDPNRVLTAQEQLDVNLVMSKI